MSTNPTTSPYIRVLVALRFPMDAEAFAARLNCEVGFRAAAPSARTLLPPMDPAVGSLQAGFDVRLTDLCPARRAASAFTDLSPEVGGDPPFELPTVLLVRPDDLQRAGNHCACCVRVPHQTSWPRLLDALATACGRKPGRGLPTNEALSNLTRRELDVLRLVGQGKSVAECAEELGVTNSTIGNHKYRLMRKLGVTNSLQLLRIAVQNGVADFA